MGLDSVEIVLGWERALGVSISDAEARELRTPRQAVDLICRKLGVARGTQGDCLSRREIREVVRAVVVDVLGPRTFGDDDDFIRHMGVDSPGTRALAASNRARAGRPPRAPPETDTR